MTDRSLPEMGGRKRPSCLDLLPCQRCGCRTSLRPSNAHTSSQTTSSPKKPGGTEELLAIELQGLIDLHFEVELTGFEIPEIDIILEDADAAKAEENGPEDRIPDPQPNASVTQPGDLWHLGKHRILCGNALEDRDYRRLLDDEKAEFVFADAPYNLPD